MTILRDYAPIKAAMTAAGYEVSEGAGFSLDDQRRFVEFSMFVLGVDPKTARMSLAYPGIIPERITQAYALLGEGAEDGGSEEGDEEEEPPVEVPEEEDPPVDNPEQGDPEEDPVVENLVANEGDGSTEEIVEDGPVEEDPPVEDNPEESTGDEQPNEV